MGYTVERHDLRGWSIKVGHAADDMESAHGYALRSIPDGDFGAILELITGPYEDLISDFHHALKEDYTRLTQSGNALATAERMYKGADVTNADEFADIDEGKNGRVESDGEMDAFSYEVGSGKLVQASSGNMTLPEVSFGFLLDKACELVAFVGGPDIREEVTKWLVGDLDKAAAQASAWDALADCTDVSDSNLSSGQSAIERTWAGDAADAAASHFGKWLSALPDQSEGMRKMAGYLRTSAESALDMAQVVVDLIKTIGNLASAALANAAIPLYGQWKLIENAKDAVKLVWRAISVIKVFWNLLKTIVDFFEAVASRFDVTALPPAPKAT